MKIQTILFILHVIISTYPGILAADINIEISDTTVTSSKSVIHLSTEEELKRFGITLENWSKFVKFSTPKSFQNHGAPKKVYYRNPTPDGDVFNDSPSDLSKGSLLPPAVTEIKFLTYKVLEHKITRKNLASEKCTNEKMNGEKNCTFHLITENYNIIKPKWSSNFGFPVEAEIGLNVKILKASSSMISNFHWMEGTIHYGPIEIGNDIRAKVTIGPSQTVRAYLYADKVTLKVAIEYAATIDGAAYLYYGNFPYSTAPIPMLLQFLSGKRDNSLRATQIVEINIYTRPMIRVLNPDTYETISVFE